MTVRPETIQFSAALRSPEAVVRLRGRVLSAARRLGLDSVRRARVTAAVSQLARRVLAAGEGEVRLRAGEGALEVRVGGPAEVLRAALDDGTGGPGERWELLDPAPGDATLVLRVEAVGEGAGASAPEGDGDDVLAAVAEQDRELLALVERLDERTGEYERLRRELEDTNRGVVALYAELDERDQRKNEFLATLAHELRNPMSVIATALHTLRAREGPWAEGEQLLGIAERQLRHLSRLVDDLLDVSRIDQNKIKLQRERIDLREVVARAVEAGRPAFERRVQHLGVEVTDQPLPVSADPTRLEQVVDNLLTNAAKYTPEGGHVELAARRENDCAVLTVSDDGIGIAAEMLDRIFNLFAQADQSLDRSSGGLGLGLTLVQRLVEMHGGSVRAESEGLERGSRFTVRLPLDDRPAAEAPAAGEEVDEEPTREGEPAAVLVVEDNDDAREMLALLLEGRGYRVGTAPDGQAGVEMGTSGEWEVAIVDIGLPGIDGFEVARRLRSSAAGQGLLLIALSGYGRPEDQQRSAEAGFDRHLVKPVEPDQLFAILAASSR